MSVCTLIDYSAREVGGFIIAPLFLMVVSLPWGWWPFLFTALVWFAAAFHMFTGWCPPQLKRPKRR